MTVVTGVEAFNEAREETEARQNVSVLLRGVKADRCGAAR